jgi:tRNA threonylcarbamoyladenosine biosynthesis protein TsaB
MPDRLTGQTLVIASGHDLSFALLDGEIVVAERHIPMQRGHSERLMPELKAMLAGAGGARLRPQRILVETGPGSFTGLRIGIAAGRALGLAWGCPVMGVRSTLLVAAQVVAQGRDADRLLVALAAPRGQIWLEGFKPQGLTSLGAPISVLPGDAAAMMRDFSLLAGTATEAAQGRPFVSCPPQAAAARFVPPHLLEAAAPLYTSPAEARVAA